MRQRKCDSCQLPRASSRLTHVEDEGDQQQQHAGLHARQHGADRHDRVQQVADVADRLQVLLPRIGDLDDRRSCACSFSLDCILRAANSSRPDRPSRRSSSASTSAGARPCAASAIMVWNHRSATSATIRAAVAVLAGHHDLGRLLADLLQHRVGALGEQAGDVALVRVAASGARRSPRPGGPACRRRTCGGIHRAAICRCVPGLSRPDRPPARRRPRRRWKKQEWRPVWQAMAGSPGARPVCSTLSRTTSLSQSRRSSCTFCTWPLSSPLCQRRWRERLQYTASPSAAVRASASRFMKASISTSLRADLLGDRRHEAVAVPLHLVEPVHRPSVAAAYGRRWVGPAKPRSAANQSSTGSVPGSTGATSTGRRLPGHRLALAHLELAAASRAPCRSAAAPGRAA